MQYNDKQAEDLLDEEPQLTKRPTVQALEDILFNKIDVLDHGFVRVIDYMGDDSAIVQAARVSYGKGTKSVQGDRGLIRYLVRNRHTTPLEMCEIKFHVKLPIFVARQWIRHRTSSVNEYSARYSILDKEFYLPKPEHLACQSKTNKQGRSGELTPEQSEEVLELLRRDAVNSYDTYEKLLNDSGDGTPIDESSYQLSRELARMNLTLNYYTQWYWKVDLHNLFNFLSLRMDSHAQYEIRVYADIISSIVSSWVPNAHEAFMDYRVGGSFMSKQEMDILKKFVITHDAATMKDLLLDSGLSSREAKEFLSKLAL